MSKKIYVGNLPFSSTEADLKDVFSRHGSVESVAVITDRESSRAYKASFASCLRASPQTKYRLASSGAYDSPSSEALPASYLRTVERRASV